MLTAKLLLGSNLCQDENICSDDTLERLAPDRFVWSERSKSKFQDVFSSPSIQEKIDSLSMMTGQGDHDVGSLIEAVTEVIVSAGDMTPQIKLLKLKKEIKNSQIKQNKWYDKDCHCLLRELKATENIKD